MAKRVHTVQESDLRMLGSLARTIQRVLPVTQADIDAAAALGQGWVVEKVFEVALPLDNCRGGTQLIIRENSITPGKYITRVMFVRGPGGQEVTVAGVPPLILPDALEEDIVSLKAFGGTEQRNLPEGYTELEYIQSTGTQYIDTGLSATYGAQYIVKAAFTSLDNTDQMLMGSLTSGNGMYFGVDTQNRSYVRVGRIDDNAVGNVLSENTVYTFDVSLVSGNSVIKVLDSLGTILHQLTVLSDVGLNNVNMFLFAEQFQNVGNRSSKARIYSAQIYNNSNMVRNFIPASRNSDNVLGMFDTVSQTFFTNAGTGTFIAGPEAYIPSEYTLLQYVANTSGTYVDLGVAFNDAGSELIVTADAVNNINYIVSARENNTMQGIAGSSTTFKAYIDPVSLTSSTTKTAGHKYQFTFTANNGNATFKTEDLTASTSDTQTTVYTVSQTQPTAHLGAFGNSYGNRTDADAKIYSIKYSVGGAPVLDLVPARKGAQIGLYNKVNGAFLTATQGSLLAGLDVPSTNPVPTPDNPIDIWCNNGVVKVSKNLFDKNKIVAGYAMNASGNITENSNFGYTDLIPVEQAEYVINNLTQGSINWTLRIHGYSSDGTWCTQIKEVVISSSVTQTNFSVSGTTIKYVRLSLGIVNRQNLDVLELYPTQRPIGSIYTDGTVETINVHGKNLFDKNDIAYNDSTILADGTIISAFDISVLDYIPVQPNTTYTYSSTTNSTRAYNKRIVCFDANKNYITSIADTTGNPSGPFSITGTTPANTRYVRVACSNDQMDAAQLELGSTATDYVPYFDGGTATCEDLLSVGTYTDEQEVISGGVTRKVGVKVFDGTETFIKPADGYAFQIADALGQTSGVGRCSHFKTSPQSGYYVQFGASGNKYVYFRGTDTDYPTATAFKQWLADQYAAGTPVIIVYPLATPTTETVTAQPMSTAEGDNIVEISQASMSGLELEVTYMAGVVLTVEEVEDAQLSPDVEVTIQ